MTSAHQLSGASAGADTGTARRPWFGLIIIVLAQLQMVLNVSALPVSLGPISADLHAPATAAATALLLYSLCVAAFVMVGAKIGKIAGERLVFRASAVVHLLSMVLMAVSTDVAMMNLAQIIAGLSAAAFVPTLVVLITANYHGRQQATALGVLAGMPAAGSAIAFVLAGFLATAFSWRYSYWLIALLGVVVVVLSLRLAPVRRQPGIRIDLVGVLLSAAAIAFILYGFNNLQTWGLLAARDAAPFSVLGVSPAPIMVVLGVVLGQAFLAWSNRRVGAGRQPLLSAEVMDSREERSAVIAFLVAGSLSLAVGFLIPLYVQFTQGRTPLASAVAILPYAAAVAGSGVLSVRLYGRFPPRRLGVASFILIAVGLVVVAFTVGNAWSTSSVILGLLLVGVGEGTLLTLLFNVLVSASPKHLAGDVGALRGVVNNVSNALGAAFSSVVAVGLLGVFLAVGYSSSELPQALHLPGAGGEVDFVTSSELRRELGAYSATPQQIDQVLAINQKAGLRTLRASFLIVGALSLLAIFPASRLPGYTAGELSAEEILTEEPARES